MGLRKLTSAMLEDAIRFVRENRDRRSLQVYSTPAKRHVVYTCERYWNRQPVGFTTDPALIQRARTYDTGER